MFECKLLVNVVAGKLAASSDAPPPVAAADQATCSKPYDPALDFFSMEFDAEKALATADLEPPLVRVAPLDNITKCRQILPKECEGTMTLVSTWE